MVANETCNAQPVKDFTMSLVLKYNRRVVLKDEFKQHNLIYIGT